jgi:uncharacterized membrane protein
MVSEVANVSYDPEVIRKHAEKLYKKAESIVTTYTLFGFFVGLIVGAVLGESQSLQMGYAFLSGCIVGIICYHIATEKAFSYKLQAQMALCQVEIEKNSRVSSRA